jgi:hypothetical protein
MARLLTTVHDAMEADMVLTRMEEAGIHAWSSSPFTSRYGSAVPQDIYVEDDELERARAALKAAEDVDQDELTRLAEESGPPPPD